MTVLNVPGPWAIDFEGESYTEADLTLLGASKALAGYGGTWDRLHPLNGPDEFIALLAAFLFQQGEDFDEAVARVAAISVPAAVAMVRPA